MEKVLTPKKVLVVDSDPAVSRALWNSCGFIADIENCGDFEDARASLMRSPPDFLVTPLRLGAYNGLHLIYLAKANHNGTAIDLLFDVQRSAADQGGAGDRRLLRGASSRPVRAVVVLADCAATTRSATAARRRSTQGISWRTAFDGCRCRQLRAASFWGNRLDISIIQCEFFWQVPAPIRSALSLAQC
jgi:DNA-binding response OmpR family regulator